tara:strand:+ start:320 stop:1207 length:888 start_codon:yes stop_codon:yes gene_type:complete
MQKRQYIGVDIGGTAIKMGRYDVNGTLLAEKEILTPQPPMPGAVVIALCEGLKDLDPNNLAKNVGIGLPGPTNPEFRVARLCINLPGWIDIPLADWLESRVNRKVTLANDGNCALLGEAWKGAAQGFQNVVLITLGTGVGGGVMLDGKLFQGHNGVAAEPGLITLWPNGPLCNSGNQGSLEQYANVQAIKRISGFSPHELFDRAEKRDKKALSDWEEYGRNLGIGISSLIYLFTPQLVLLGGGISYCSKYFLPSVISEISKRVEPLSREGLIIRPCKLGNAAGCFGAALIAIQRL